MKTKTVANCFILLLAMAMAAFLVEGVVAPLMNKSPSPIYKILPLTSLPILWEKLTRNVSSNDALLEKTSQERKNVSEKNIVTLSLTNSNEVTGELVSEQGEWVTVNIAGSHVGFHRSEIKAMRSGK